MEFHYLANHTALIPEIASWFESALPAYYGPNGPGNAQRDLIESTNTTELPITIFATKNGVVCGVVSFTKTSIYTHQQLSPWITNLLVKDVYKNENLEMRLTALVEDVARKRGYDRIYTGALTQDPALEAYNWNLIEVAPHYLGDVYLYEKSLV